MLSVLEHLTVLWEVRSLKGEDAPEERRGGQRNGSTLVVEECPGGKYSGR